MYRIFLSLIISTLFLESAKASEEEADTSPETPILKVSANTNGNCDDIEKYPYVYYGKNSEKAGEGEYDKKLKYFVCFDFLKVQMDRYQSYLARCKSAHASLVELKSGYGKESEFGRLFMSAESQLKAALSSCSMDKISSLSPQHTLFDVVRIKRILKYKYLVLIKSFSSGLTEAAAAMNKCVEEMDEVPQSARVASEDKGSRENESKEAKGKEEKEEEVK